MGTLLQDLKYAARGLRKNPGFAAIAILTMALGIGANTAIFSVVNAVLLRPLPYPEPGRLVQIYTREREGVRFSLSYPDYEDIRGLGQAFSGVAAYTTSQFNFTGKGDPREIQGAYATSDLFSVLGVGASLGRTFSEDETRAPYVVLSHALWVSVFGSDPAVLGHSITLDGAPYTVIGVMPAWFQFPNDDVQLWAPLGRSLAQTPEAETNRGFHAFNAVGRLAPGISRERAASDLNTLASRITTSQQPTGNGGPERREVRITASGPPPAGGGGGARIQVQDANTTSFMAVPLTDDVVGNARPTLLVLFGTVLLVLLIACANAGNLMVARANARRREIVIRQALGAGRGRIARQILSESVLLSLAAGAAGVLMSYWGLDLLLASWPPSLPPAHDVTIDRWVLLFTLAVSVVTGLAFGIIPAVRASTPGLEEALREDGASVSVSRRRHRTLRVMVASQLAIALVLLVGAGLLVRSFVRLLEVDPGYDTRNVLAARIRLTPSRYPERTAQNDFYTRVTEDLGSRPGVNGVTLSRTLPLSGAMMILAIDPRTVNPNDPEQFLTMAMRVVGTSYFGTMRIPILQGRPFDAGDRADSPPVVVVNGKLAKRLWPDQDPLGKHLPLDGPDTGPYDATVVGVVGDIHYAGLNDEVRPEVYLPQPQTRDTRDQMWVIIRADRDPMALAAVVRDAVRRVDAVQPVADLVSLEQMVGRSTAARRFNMTLVTLFAALAFALAVIGVYGVTSYAVSQRTRELGIRIALGAGRSDVMGMVLREGAVLAGAGVVAGAVLAIVAARALASMLYDVTTTDLPTYLAMAIVLALAALFATWIPARRAAKVDPIVALKSE
jgi:putative ABC transport system permease protein